MKVELKGQMKHPISCAILAVLSPLPEARGFEISLRRSFVDISCFTCTVQSYRTCTEVIRFRGMVAENTEPWASFA